MAIVFLLCEDGNVYADAACSYKTVEEAQGNYDDEIPLAVVQFLPPKDDRHRTKSSLTAIEALINGNDSFMYAMEHLVGEIFKAGQAAERKRIFDAAILSAEAAAAAKKA